MIEIVIPEYHYHEHDRFDDQNEEFLPDIDVDIEETRIQLEHSLLSLKKWEQKWHKPFLRDDKKTYEEIIDYIRCMTLTHGVKPDVYNHIPEEVVEQIVKYIEDPMTATWFKDDGGLVGAQKSSREIITAEIIYYWMITLNIPVEFQKWHLKQLLTLIKVVNIKNQKPKKVDEQAAARERAALNAKRKKQYNSNG